MEEGRLDRILEQIERTRADTLKAVSGLSEKLTEQQITYARCSERQEQRWEAHAEVHRDLATKGDIRSLEHLITETSRKANGTAELVTENRISLAKLAGIGASAGSVAALLLEGIRLLVSKLGGP